jgi:FMN phosphatase YigB (HAD superfamily)
MHPKFLYFDLGNVILHFSHRRAAEQMAEVAGISAEKVWEHLFESPLASQFDNGKITPRQFYESFCSDTGSRPDFDALMLAVSAIFTLNTPIVPVLGQLRAAGYRLGILSNTCDPHWEYCCRTYPLLRVIFERHILSFREQVSKPAQQIFDAAAASAGCAPGDIFFTDDLPTNVAGAQEAGLDAVLFTTVPDLVVALRERGVSFNY